MSSSSVGRSCCVDTNDGAVRVFPISSSVDALLLWSCDQGRAGATESNVQFNLLQLVERVRSEDKEKGEVAATRRRPLSRVVERDSGDAVQCSAGRRPRCFYVETSGEQSEECSCSAALQGEVSAAGGNEAGAMARERPSEGRARGGQRARQQQPREPAAAVQTKRAC